MKTYRYDGEKVKIIKELGLKDKEGTWVQIEILTGDQKGNRKPIVKENLKG